MRVLRIRSHASDEKKHTLLSSALLSYYLQDPLEMGRAVPGTAIHIDGWRAVDSVPQEVKVPRAERDVQLSR